MQNENETSTPDSKGVGSSALFALSVVDLQRKFRLGYVLAKRLHEQLQTANRPGSRLVFREDEMLIFHSGGKYLATVYAADPECAAAIIRWAKEQAQTTPRETLTNTNDER